LCEREQDSLHAVLQDLGGAAGAAPRWDETKGGAGGGLVTLVLLRQLLFQLVPDLSALLSTGALEETLWCARPELPQRYDNAMSDFCHKRNLSVLADYRRLAAAARALNAASFVSLEALATAAATRAYVRQTPRPVQDEEETSDRLLHRALGQRQLLVRTLCVLGLVCCQRRARDVQRFKQLWHNAIHAYDEVQLQWIALAGERSGSRQTLEATCESDYQALSRLCESEQPPRPAAELLPEILQKRCVPDTQDIPYPEWLRNHARLGARAQKFVARVRARYGSLSNFALARCGWVLPADGLPPEPPDLLVGGYLGWLRRAGLVDLVNKELQDILARA